MNELSNDLLYLTLIAGRKQKDALLETMADNGCLLMNYEYGRGSVKSGYIKDMLGLVYEEQKVVITCLIKSCNIGTVMNLLSNDFGFDKANTGIAFTVPVQKLSF